MFTPYNGFAALMPGVGHFPAARLLLAGGALVLFGCATPRGPDVLHESRIAATTIEVRVADFAPGTVTASDADPTEDTTIGAAVGATPGLIGVAAFAPMCGNPITAGVCAIAVPIFAVMAVAGGGTGAAYGKSAGDMKFSAQRALARAVSGNAAQFSLVARTAEYGATVTNRGFTQPSPSPVDQSPPKGRLDLAMLKADGVEVKGGFGGLSPRTMRSPWRRERASSAYPME